MKSEDYMESIYEYLERIKTKINGLSSLLLEESRPEVSNDKDGSFLKEIRQNIETFYFTMRIDTEQVARELDIKAKSIKGKSITDESKKVSLWRV